MLPDPIQRRLDRHRNLLQARLLRVALGTRPVSRFFARDRGHPIDRYYIDQFLAAHQSAIRGTVLEVAETRYTKAFGGDRVEKALVLLPPADTRPCDITADLVTGEGIRDGIADCFILTQTLLLLYDLRSACRNALRLVKPGGHLLVTVPGIGQLSRTDYNRWGQYWNFTDLALRRLFEEHVPSASITTATFGNVKAAAALLYGLASHEISRRDLDLHDPDYQVTVAAAIRRPSA